MLVNFFRSRRSPRRVPAAPSFRPKLEMLDDRITPATFKVTLTTDTGLTDSLVTPLGPGTVGDLRNAIFQADQTPGTQNVIDLTGVSGTITLSAMLPPIFTTGSGSLLIVGSGTSNLTISGNGAVRPFFITSGTVGIANLTITKGLAQGGNGVDGGGGGAGLGGGLLIDGTLGATNVTLTNVAFTGNQAVGGNGGTAGAFVGGGGGGAGGNAGAAGDGFSGGGGFLGVGGNGGFNGSEGTGGGGGGFTGAGGAFGNNGSPIGGGGGGGGTGSTGGGDGSALEGGGGGSSGFPGSSSGAAAMGAGGAGGFGGGGGGSSDTGSAGGAGGDYGGGGGASTGAAGNGGFSGGGGSGGLNGNGGNGGFGGGGGGQGVFGGVPGLGMNGGGNGDASGNGGGGAGLGGAVFVRAGTLNLIDDTFTNNTATGGGGATGGQGVGGAIFVNVGATATALGAAPTFNGNVAATSNNDLFGTLPTDAAATLTTTGGNSQSADLNTAFGMPLQATLKAGTGNPIPNAVLPFFVPTSGASATLSPLGGPTNLSGQVSVNATANGTAGSYVVTAGGSVFKASFNLQNVVPSSGLPIARPVNRFATGSATGGFVSVYDNGRPILVNATPYVGFAGGVAVALGDVNADGVLDLATVIASDGPSEVKVFNGNGSGLLLDFNAFPTSYTGGASIALGDLDGDGRAEIIVGSLTGISVVAVYDGLTGAFRTAFVAYPEAPVGVFVAAADLNGDQKAELITGPTGIAPLVRVFNGNSGFVRQFFAFDPALANVGVTVGAGDLDGDGRAEILLGANAYGVDYAIVFNGSTMQRTILPLALTGQILNLPRVIGPQLAVADTNNDGVAELLVTAGSALSVFDGPSLAPLGTTILGPNLGGLYIA